MVTTTNCVVSIFFFNPDTSRSLSKNGMPQKIFKACVFGLLNIRVTKCIRPFATDDQLSPFFYHFLLRLCYLITITRKWNKIIEPGKRNCARARIAAEDIPYNYFQKSTTYPAIPRRERKRLKENVLLHTIHPSDRSLSLRRLNAICAIIAKRKK